MSLPVEEQERALREAALAWHWRNNQRASKEQVAEELRYGSVEAVRRQFENWGIPSWVVGEESETNSTPSKEGKKSPPREPKPRDSKDAAQDIARDLADIAPGSSHP
jgi:hypothetical protein